MSVLKNKGLDYAVPLKICDYEVVRLDTYRVDQSLIYVSER
jgi:hypothetical protein